MNHNLIAIIAQFLDHDTYVSLLKLNGNLSRHLLSRDTIRNLIGSLYSDKVDYRDLFIVFRYIRYYRFIKYKDRYIEHNVFNFMQSLSAKFSQKTKFDYCVEVFESDDHVLFGFMLNSLFNIYQKDEIVFFVNLHFYLMGRNILRYIKNLPSQSIIGYVTEVRLIDIHKNMQDAILCMKQIYDIVLLPAENISSVAPIEGNIDSAVAEYFKSINTWMCLIKHTNYVAYRPQIFNALIYPLRNRDDLASRYFVLRIELVSDIKQTKCSRVLKHYGKIRGYL